MPLVSPATALLIFNLPLFRDLFLAPQLMNTHGGCRLEKEAYEGCISEREAYESFQSEKEWEGEAGVRRERSMRCRESIGVR